jgi:hypothetical protein
MVDWQITATTIYCDAIEEEVTLLVYKDGTARCTGYARYGEPGQETKTTLNKKAGQLKRVLKCQGMECPRIIRYRDGLLAAEKDSRT